MSFTGAHHYLIVPEKNGFQTVELCDQKANEQKNLSCLEDLGLRLRSRVGCKTPAQIWSGSFALDDSSAVRKGSADRKLAVELWLMVRDPANFQTRTTLWQGIRT